MKKSIALTALLALSSQFAFAADHTSAKPAPRPAPKIKLTFDVIHEGIRASSFMVTTDSSLPMSLRIRAGYDIRNRTPQTQDDEAFEGVLFDVTPIVTAYGHIQLTLEAEKSEFKQGISKSYTDGVNIFNVPQTPDLSILSKVVVLEDDKNVSLPFGTNTLNIHAKLEDVGGANE